MRSRGLGLLVVLVLAAGVVVAASPGAGGAESSTEVSVSNLGETGTNHWCSAQADWTCAQGFTTGSATGGYTLTSITATFKDKAGSPGDIVVTLHAAATSSGSDGKRPDTVLATLAGSNPDTAGDHTFTCSGSGCDLAADTTYFVKFSSSGTDNANEYRWKTVLNAFGQTTVPADNGWTLADELDYRHDGNAWTAATDLAGYLKVAAEPAQASLPPSNPPADVDAGSLTLTMYGDTITAVWDHVADATSYHLTLKAQGAPGTPADIDTAWPAFDGDGNAANRKTGDDTKMSLTIADAAATAGHQSGTYWFGLRAANAAGSSAWKAKAVSPSPPSLSVVNVSENSVTLQLDGYGGQWYYRQESGAQPQALEAQGAFGAESLGGKKQANQQQSNQNQCVGPFSSQQANVGNLNSGTEYTFGAYSDGACTAESQIANAEISTWTESAYLAAQNVTPTGATLELSDHSGGWWYKRTEGPASTTCHAVSSGTTTATLSGLTGGMHYQYVAYSASGCNNADVIAWRGFTTPGEHVYNWYHLTGSNTCNVGYLTSFSSKCATAFTTGNSSAGYTLSEIKARFNTPVGSPGALIVAIHAADTGDSSNPAASAKVTLSSGYTDGDWRTFLCSGASCELDRETKYFVVMSTADTSGDKYYPWVATTSDAEDVKPSNSRWSIANRGRTSGGSGWSDISNSGTGSLYVGAAAPSLTATNIADTSATLTFPGRHSSWWYERTHPTTTSCAAGGSSVSLSTLTANTLYGYTAYSDSSCSDSNKLDTEYFSTTDYDVGNLAELHTDNCLVGNHHSGFQRCAIGFTTGGRSGGYTLRSVTGRFEEKQGHTITAKNNLGPITVAIHAANGGNPAATALATLSGADPNTAGLYTFTCSGSCDLDANTSYFVVMSTTDTTNQAWYNLSTTDSDDEARHPFNNGWSIEDVSQTKQGNNDWSDIDTRRTGVIHVAADDAPDSVSSLGNANSSWDPVGNHSYSVRKPASQFTTGSNSGGYDLLSVTIEISGVDNSPGDLTVAVYTNDSNDRPGTLVTTLSGNNPTGSGQYTFTCSSSCTLSASTKYQLWLDAPNAPNGYNFYRWRTSSSSGETTEPSGNGWSIGESIMRIDSSWANLTPYFKYRVTAARK